MTMGTVSRSGVAEPETMAPLVLRLRALAGDLADRLPDATDGAAWLHVDTALTCLYGALVELEGLDGVGRTAAGADTSNRSG